MRTALIYLVIALVILAGAFYAGGRYKTQEYKDNLNKQVEIQRKTNEKVSTFTDNDYCTTVLHGRLSESGECE